MVAIASVYSQPTNPQWIVMPILVVLETLSAAHAMIKQNSLAVKGVRSTISV
jgi:hypothetical protein